MRANKWGVRFTLAITVASLFMSIIFTTCNIEWWKNFSFALFGSSIISLIICLITHKCLSKSSAREIVTSIFAMNENCFANLYSSKVDTTLEETQKALGIAISELYKAYILTLEHIEGLFWRPRKYDTLKREFKSFKSMIEAKLKSLQDLGFYIEFCQEHTEKNTKKLYYILDKEVSDQKLYRKAMIIAKKYFKDIYSYEENDNSKDIKKRHANSFKTIVEQTTIED